MNKSATRAKLTTFILLLLYASLSWGQQGITALESSDDVATTVNRLNSALVEKGMKVFAAVDHAAGAASIGDSLPPTVVVIFGNPKVGTGMMKCAQSVGIDLPMKALVWQDASGKTYGGYNDPAYLKNRHGMEGCDALLDKVSAALSNFASAAAGS
ncbi:MAG: DUF302 domain-containing protein [Gammaproteobacteria bacterium]|nr:DUF302 domain-containing protein [Gammaproteobacteria bacterium]